ncbi:MAG: GNAT family N-acetyltransferase [Alphaproteobacteria bacterium]|nr:GNAT family N-acetyltransferase [Alphaproteobacteria bacterium]
MAGDIRVVSASKADAQRWNVFLDRQATVSPWAHLAWQTVLAEAYGADCRFLVAEQEGRLAGLLPAYVVRDWLGRRRLYSLRGGLLADAPAGLSALLAAAEAIPAASRLMAVPAGSEAPGWQARPRETLVLPLASSEDATWRGLRDKTRNMIRKAEKSGIAVEADWRHLDAFHRLYALNGLRLGLPLHGRAFFAAVARHLGESAVLLTAWRADRPVGGMLLLLGRGTALYPWQAADPESRNLGVVQALNWQAMRLAIARGLPELDMGESQPGGPVHQSKLNFGGRPRPLLYLARPAGEAGGGVAASPEGWGERLERWLRPAPLALRRWFAERRLRRGRVV